MMGTLRIALLAGIALAPIGALGWIALNASRAFAFPLSSELAADPHSPASLTYALERIAAPESAPSAAVAAAPAALNASSAPSSADLRATRELREAAAETARLSEDAAAYRALELIGRIEPDESPRLPELLAVLETRAPASARPELAEAILSSVVSPRTGNLGSDPAWRLTVAGLAYGAYRKLATPGPASESAWRARASALEDASLRAAFLSVAAGEPETGAGAAAPTAPTTVRIGY